MRSRTRKPPAPAVVRPPPPPPEPPVTPLHPWPARMADYSASRWGQRSGGRHLRELAEMDLHLPPWQRGQVWTGEQQRALCRALWRGLPVAPILLWEQRTDSAKVADPKHRDGYRYVGATRTVVLDGQQRLAALGVPMRRWDGVPLVLPEAYLDLEDGTWKAEPMAGLPHALTMLAVTDPFGAGRIFWSAQGEAERRLMRLWCEAAEYSGRPDLMTYTIPSSTCREEVIEIYRSWNAPGTPFPPDEVDALIRGADMGWIPAADEDALTGTGLEVWRG